MLRRTVPLRLASPRPGASLFHSSFETIIPTPARHVPWNKGKVTGQKPPLKPREVWAIRVRLHIAGRTRDLALFNLAILSALSGRSIWKVSSTKPA